MAQQTEEPGTAHVYVVHAVAYVFCVNRTSKELSPGQLWCDVGCARGLGRSTQRHALEKEYRQHNVCPVIDKCRDTFQFWNGTLEQATTTKTYPVFVHGMYRGSINQTVVKSRFPIRFSKAVMADWDTGLRSGRHDVTLNMFDATLPVIEDKVPVCGIIAVDIPNFRTQWHRIPQGYQFSGHGPRTLSLNERPTTT